MIEQNSKGQWEVHYEGQWAKFPTKEEAEARLNAWKGETPSKGDDKGVPVEELDADNDGYITKEEISVRFP